MYVYTNLIHMQFVILTNLLLVLKLWHARQVELSPVHPALQ